MLKRNELLKTKDGIFRVLEVQQDEVIVIDCIKQTMPRCVSVESFQDAERITENDLLTAMGIEEEMLTLYDNALAHSRFTMIVPALAVIGNRIERSIKIRLAAEQYSCSMQTIRSYLCRFLAFQDIRMLAPGKKDKEVELTPDQKNMRWALNKFFYNRYRNPLTSAYLKMLQAKYTDGEGKLLSKYPSIHQFRYFYQKYNKMQTYFISRGGIKDYQRNHRPLLGDGVQEFVPAVGWGMLDSTVCDIYLVNDAGQVVGRPLLTAAVDAYSSLCLGYVLAWEGGVYSLRKLVTNVLEDKVVYCRRHGIEIKPEQWPASGFLPGVIVTDRGSEYTSETFSQIAERGVTIVNVESFRPELKGSVEKLFDLIQTEYEQHLHGYGTLEADYAERGAKDYRKEAKLTLKEFEQIVIRCIIYYNSQRLVEDFPYTEEMLEIGVKPYAAALHEYGRTLPGANLIPCTVEDAMLSLLPRTTGQFTRSGLKVNGLRYKATGFTEEYLRGGTVTVAYNPEDISEVWLLRGGGYIPFQLIEQRFQGKTLEQVGMLKQRQKNLESSEKENQLQKRIDLANHIDAVSHRIGRPEIVDLKGIRETRQREREKNHMNFCERRKGV